MFRLRSFYVDRPLAVPFVLVVVAALAFLAPIALRAATEKQLSRVKGTVGYQTADAAPFTPVIGRFLLPDDSLAVTRANSAAMLALPDSSLVTLGQNTRVQVGAFNDTAAGPGATITVNGGALRFDIKRPVGGAANYRFVTPSTQIAVRGTIGVLSFFNGITTVGCIVCQADSIFVTVGAQVFQVLAGSVLTVTAAGAVIPGTFAGAAASGFSAAGVSTSASTGVAGATAGVASGAAAAGAGAAAGAATTAIAAGAVGVGVAAAAVTTNNNKSNNATAAPTQSTPSPSPSASPTATPTQSGSIGITRKPTAPPTQGPATPVPARTSVPAPPPGRFGR